MIRLLIDEDVHRSIFQGLRRRLPDADIVRVQNVGMLSIPDADILEWAAAEARVVVTADKKSVAAEAWNRVANGLPVAGVAMLRPMLTIGQAIQEIELLAVISTPDDLRNRVIYLPL